MKKSITLILAYLSFTIITGCNGKISSNSIGNTSDRQESLSESSLIGAWKYEDSYYGKIFVQFEVAGVIKVFFNYEGEVLEVGNWQLQDNKVIVSDCNLFSELIISDFNGNSFKLPPTTTDVSLKTNREFIIVERLLDEAGEPILHYSQFDKDPVADPRYGDQESNSLSQQNSSSETLDNAFQCKECGLVAHQKEHPWNRFGGDCSSNSLGHHSWIRVQEVVQWQCEKCGSVSHQKEHPWNRFGGDCPSNSLGHHSWIRAQ